MKRGKGKIKTGKNVRNAYKIYVSEWSKITNQPLPYTEYRKLIDLCNQTFMNKIIQESLILKLPFGLGKIRIRKIKPYAFSYSGKFQEEKFYPDWDKSKKYWKELYPNLSTEEIHKIPNKPLIRYSNNHTDGHRMSFYWEKKHIKIPGIRAYGFLTTRKNDRELGAWLKSPYRKNNYYN